MRNIRLELEKERNELRSKMNKLSVFRGTEEWKKLSTNHKQLLDIQLSAMSTYMETLTGRILDIREKCTDNKEDKNDEDVVAIIVIEKD